MSDGRVALSFLVVQTTILAFTIQRVSTIYKDIDVGLLTGHFEHRNAGLTLVLLALGVSLAFVGVATSRETRPMLRRPVPV